MPYSVFLVSQWNKLMEEKKQLLEKLKIPSMAYTTGIQQEYAKEKTKPIQLLK